MIEQPCPHCDHPISDVTAISDNSKAQMQPGDLSVCIYCGGYLHLGLDRLLYILSDEEFIELPLAERRLLIRAQSVIRKRPQ